MAIGILEIGQLLSVVVAASTPGMTYYVMARLHKQQIGHMAENCKACKAALDEKLGCLDESVDELDGRQKELREKTLPDVFVKRRDLDALEKKHEREIEIVHKRIEKYHPGVRGAS
jgi:hypothetical protein